MATITFTVSGMSCQHCVKTVQNAVGGIDGVEGCEINLEQGLVHVTAADASLKDTIAEAITEEGYTVNGYSS